MIVPAASVVANSQSNGYVRFERGPESMFRRVLIQDASGNLLENFEHYNDLYCLTELLTNNKSNREGPGCFHGEGLQLPGRSTPSVVANAGVYANGMAMVVDQNPLGSLTIVNGKYEPMTYADLGSAVIAKQKRR